MTSIQTRKFERTRNENVIECTFTSNMHCISIIWSLYQPFHRLRSALIDRLCKLRTGQFHVPPCAHGDATHHLVHSCASMPMNPSNKPPPTQPVRRRMTSNHPRPIIRTSPQSLTSPHHCSCHRTHPRHREPRALYVLSPLLLRLYLFVVVNDLTWAKDRGDGSYGMGRERVTVDGEGGRVRVMGRERVLGHGKVLRNRKKKTHWDC